MVISHCSGFMHFYSTILWLCVGFKSLNLLARSSWALEGCAFRCGGHVVPVSEYERLYNASPRSGTGLQHYHPNMVIWWGSGLWGVLRSYICHWLLLLQYNRLCGFCQAKNIGDLVPTFGYCQRSQLTCSCGAYMDGAWGTPGMVSEWVGTPNGSNHQYNAPESRMV